MRTFTPQQYKLIKLSLYIQLGFSAAVLLYAITSLLVQQFLHPSADYRETVNYNLITFILSLNFPSPITAFLMPSDDKNDNRRVDNYPEENPQSLTNLRDLPLPNQHDEKL